LISTGIVGGVGEGDDDDGFPPRLLLLLLLLLSLLFVSAGCCAVVAPSDIVAAAIICRKLPAELTVGMLTSILSGADIMVENYLLCACMLYSSIVDCFFVLLRRRLLIISVRMKKFV